MSAHVLLVLMNELGKRDKKARLAEHFISFATSLINSLIQGHECQILYDIKITLKSHFCRKTF